MGLVYAEIELINNDDLALQRRHKLGEEEVRCLTVTSLVDTGAYMLCYCWAQFLWKIWTF